MAFVIKVLLNSVKFHAKHINCDDRSESLVIFINIQISQGSVATQLRQAGRLYHGYIDHFFTNLPVKELWKSAFIYSINHQKSSLGFFDSVYTLVRIVMSDRLRQTTLVCNQHPRPTQPPTPRGTGDDYWPVWWHSVAGEYRQDGHSICG